MYWNLRQIAISQSAFRLTLTWDVLKCSQFWTDFNFYKGLTLTWDVLKLLKLSYPCSSSIGLTLTWDVLKW